ncbi:hypothetical protein FQA39_LY14129 [Lamprigera yunnana]|nr:hypothetical protein FQA39_LY14129 [Lamprigera yunnana]
MHPFDNNLFTENQFSPCSIKDKFCLSAYVVGQNPPGSSSADAVESQEIQIHETVPIVQDSIAFADLIETQNLISEIREGRLERARKLINSFGLSYSQAWSDGYVLLRDAVKNKHAAVVKLLLSSGSKVNSKNKKPYTTPLHFAVINSDIEIVKMILDNGADIDAKNIFGRTPLSKAIINKEMEVIKLLLKHRADANARDDDGTSVLHVAAEIGCLKISGISNLALASTWDTLQIVENILKYGAYVNCVCTSTWKKGFTPLTVAVVEGHKEVIMLLLSRGANVDVKGEDNITPLHIATKYGYIRPAEDLLNHGACIHSLTLKEGYTPLHFASNLGNEGAYCPDINDRSNRSSLKIAVYGYGKEYKKIVESLLEYGLIVNLEDVNNPKLLHAVVEKGYLKIIEELLKYGANVNTLYNSDFTLLHSAAKNKQDEATMNAVLKITKLLLTNRANIKDSPELLKIAVKKECIEIVEALLLHGADINAGDKYGNTALHFTALRESIDCFESLTIEDPPIHIMGEIAELLLSKGANVDAQTKNGVTVLHIASEKGYQEIIETILKFDANINSRDEYSRIALHIASQVGHVKVVATLLEYGSDINIMSRNILTLLDYAMGGILYSQPNNYDSNDYYDPGRGDCLCEVTVEVLKHYIHENRKFILLTVVKHDNSETFVKGIEEIRRILTLAKNRYGFLVHIVGGEIKSIKELISNGLTADEL